MRKKTGTFLRRLPLVHQAEGVTFVHATPDEPGEWNYIFAYPEAEQAFGTWNGELAFIGHSHRPVILTKRGRGSVNTLERQIAILEMGIRYIINVGSVGQPRDGNPRAAYGLYDEGGRKFLLRRVPYDIPAAQQKIIRAGLPASLAQRLSEGR